MWPVLGSFAVAGLALWLTVGLVRLHEVMRQAEHDARLDRRIGERVMRGNSLSWNDETPAELGGHRGSADTHSRKG